MLAPGQGLNRRRTEPGAQYPVEGRGISTPLRMPHHRQARLVGARGVDVLVELCCGEFRPFGGDDYEVRLALLVGLPYEPDQVLRVRLELRYKYRLGPSRDRAHQRQVAAVTPHHLYDVRPVVGARGVLDAVYCLQRCV